MSDQRTRLLRRIAQSAEGSPVFLAELLARYREVEQIDENEVARRLAMDAPRLDELAICRRPRPDQFAQDVLTIADRVGADAGALAGIIRQVDALNAFAGSTGGGMLAAARDAEDDDASEDDE